MYTQKQIFHPTPASPILLNTPMYISPKNIHPTLLFPWQLIVELWVYEAAGSRRNHWSERRIGLSPQPPQRNNTKHCTTVLCPLSFCLCIRHSKLQEHTDLSPRTLMHHAPCCAGAQVRCNDTRQLNVKYTWSYLNVVMNCHSDTPPILFSCPDGGEC